jgi:hypothetical protein
MAHPLCHGISPVRRGLPFALVGLLLPSAASACTWCVSSAFGDRTFNWPYLSLIVAPFVVAATIAGVLTYYHWKMRGPDLAPQTPRRSQRPGEPGALFDTPRASIPKDAARSSALDKETT